MRRALPLVVFLMIAGALLLAPVGGWMFARKVLNCFISPLGLLLFVLLAATCLVTERGAAERVLRGMSPVELWVLLPGMALVSVAVGWRAFEVSSFTHAMLNWWGFHSYRLVMKGNMARSCLPTLAVFLLMRPWRFIPRPVPLRMLKLATGYVLLNYIVAFLAYARFQTAEVQ